MSHQVFIRRRRRMSVQFGWGRSVSENRVPARRLQRLQGVGGRGRRHVVEGRRRCGRVPRHAAVRRHVGLRRARQQVRHL